MAFKLKPDKKESENKTIRFPVDLIDEINTAIAKKEVSFLGICYSKPVNMLSTNLKTLMKTIPRITKK